MHSIAAIARNSEGAEQVVSPGVLPSLVSLAEGGRAGALEVLANAAGTVKCRKKLCEGGGSGVLARALCAEGEWGNAHSAGLRGIFSLSMSMSSRREVVGVQGAVGRLVDLAKGNVGAKDDHGLAMRCLWNMSNYPEVRRPPCSLRVRLARVPLTPVSSTALRRLLEVPCLWPRPSHWFTPRGRNLRSVRHQTALLGLHLG